MRPMGHPEYVYTPHSSERRRRMSISQRERFGIPAGFRKIAGEIVAEEDVAATLKRLYPCERCGVARAPTARRCITCQHEVMGEQRAVRLAARKKVRQPRVAAKPPAQHKTRTKGIPIQRQRLLNGLCPSCGKDAAPYRLCPDHRALESLTRLLSRWEKAGALTKSRGPGGNHWKATANMREIIDAMPARRMPLWDGGEDARTLPRLRGVPVDVEATIVEILRDRGRPATVEEIQAAWGRLRGERKHGSLAGDIGRIIKAQHRRDQRSARRAHYAHPDGGESGTCRPMSQDDV